MFCISCRPFQIHWSFSFWKLSSGVQCHYLMVWAETLRLSIQIQMSWCPRGEDNIANVHHLNELHWIKNKTQLGKKKITFCGNDPPKYTQLWKQHLAWNKVFFPEDVTPVGLNLLHLCCSQREDTGHEAIPQPGTAPHSPQEVSCIPPLALQCSLSLCPDDWQTLIKQLT